MVMSDYKPPYKITPTMISLIEKIGEALGVFALSSAAEDLRLRRIHRIQTIRGSLAIEGNSLSEEQISTILDGKPVIAPPREVQEVRNAIKAYDAFQSWNPALQRDLLKAHETLMVGLLDAPGHYRSGGVGVGGASGIVHVAPPPGRVPELMSNLFDWLENTPEHALIKSCVFHYEFEFIHPFEDGNGRMGRLWQTLILSHWNPLFSQIPVENMVYAEQQDYYAAIAKSTKAAESTPFIEFMLHVIEGALTKNVTANDPLSGTVNFRAMKTPEAVLACIAEDNHVTRQEMADQMGKSVRSVARAIKRLQDSGRLKRIGSDKAGHWEIIDDSIHRSAADR
jgi:Fic family protein